MEEKLLHKPDNVALAEYIVDVLKKNDISCRQHDEKLSQHPGTYGPDEGIALYVKEEDYEKAKEIIQPIITPITAALFCPSCGAEDIEALPDPFQKYRTPILLISIVLELLPLVYFAWNVMIAKIATRNGNILAIISLAISIILMIVANRTKARYHCRKCGKKFSRD